MYDRDILALQVGASLTSSDTYLIQLLHKFNLLDWVRYIYILISNILIISLVELRLYNIKIDEA